jgi:mono/diheme cytochrome c family protein
MNTEDHRNEDGGNKGSGHDGAPVVDLHEPIYREMAEPRDGFEPPPTWLVFLCLAIMGFAGWYLGMYSGGFRADVYDERGWSGRPASSVQEPVKIDPMVLGKRVYNNCLSCHQANGLGVPGNYPPLDGSEWVTDRPVHITALLLHGLEGEIEVMGELYNQVMPKWGHLTDEQVASVLTYIRASWSNQAGPIDPAFVAEVRQQSSDRTRPWNSADLDEFVATFVPPVVDQSTDAADG